LSTVIEAGTSCRFCARLLAVTMTDSSLPLSACCASGAADQARATAAVMSRSSVVSMHVIVSSVLLFGVLQLDCGSASIRVEKNRRPHAGNRRHWSYCC
jgi:hypothetical protein